MKKGLVILLLIGWAVPHASAQSRIEDDPGYVDFTELDNRFGEDPTIEINIHGALLRLVAEASELEDPDLADLLRRIRGVYVRAFDLRGLDLDDVRNLKDRISRDLERRDWQAIVKVRDSSTEEDVSMYVRLVGEEIAGMAVMSVNRREDQTVFLNIVGDIDPEQIGRIGRKFGVDGARDW